MRVREKQLGDKNRIGKSVTLLRKQNGMTQKALMAQMQIKGIDINYSSLSKLEGQSRIATDKELYVLAQIFNVTMEALF